MSDDIRAEILDAATERFAAHGFAATSLAQIAEDVGIRKASLLYHFESKEALQRAVFDRLLSHWNDVLPRLLAAAAGDDRFDALLDECIRFFVVEPRRARLVLREILDRPDEVRSRFVVALGPWIGAIAGSIRKGQKHGQPLRANVDAEAYLLHVIHLVVCGVATADTLGLVLDSSTDAAIERLTRELKRVARTSLFHDVDSDRSVDGPKPRARRARAHRAGSPP